jgi:hypothetical protein
VSDHTFPDVWRAPLEEFGGEARPVDTPEGASGDWYEVYSRFATRGFIRAIVSPSEATTAVRLQLAIPTGSDADRDVLGAVRDEMSEVLGGDWEISELTPDWELVGELPEVDEGSVAQFLRRLEQLGEAASDSPQGADWLEERLVGAEGSADVETSTDQPDTSSSTDHSGSPPAGGDGGVFETIGRSESSGGAPSGMLQEAGLTAFEIGDRGDKLEVRVGLDISLPVPDREKLGRALAHALQGRYDLDVRPLPPEDEAGAIGESRVRLMVEPADIGIAGDISVDEMRSQVERYFERLERFDGLGVTLADVLGVGDDLERDDGGPSDSDVRAGKRGTGRRGDRASEDDVDEHRRPSSRGDDDRGSRSGRDGRRDSRSERETGDTGDSAASPPGRSTDREAEESEPETGFVLDVDGTSDKSSDAGKPASGGLEAGNYRDPRLLREDATTSLVDVVLRHPGYAEEKMGHNLSILLDADYPDAMELVQTAPCVIAWGVGRDRGMKFKRVIERAGGKVVLVEPDSLSE